MRSSRFSRFSCSRRFSRSSRSSRPSAMTPPLLTATLPGFLKSVEQSPGVGARERFEPMRLADLDGVAGDRSDGSQEFGFLLHLRMPPVFVILAHVHEDAHLRNRLEFGLARFPHKTREGGDGQKVLRICGRDME